jgi:hypothetical protein
MNLQNKVLRVADKQEHQESQPSPQEGSRLWAVARLSDRALYRQEMARQLHIMRGKQNKIFFFSLYLAFSVLYRNDILLEGFELFLIL